MRQQMPAARAVPFCILGCALKWLEKKRRPTKSTPGRIGIMMMLFLLAALPICTAHAEEIDIAARAAILIDAASGRTLYAKNADTRCPMASTTKIMTALLALENSAPDEVVTASERASGTGGTSIYLGAGEQLSMHEMLLGLMLRSGNDAAVAIAEHIAGSVEDFAAMMNARAAELGADAFFVTPNGLDADGHGASARAMALIAREAMKREDFRVLVSTQRAVIPWRDSQYSRVLSSKNRLLREYDGATGIKTGFTSRAGRCLVFSAERNGLELIGVVLSCGAWFDEAERLLDWGFEGFSAAQAAQAGEQVARVRIAQGKVDTVAVTAENDLSAAVCDQDSWSVQMMLYHETQAPVHRGDCLGQMTLTVNGEIVGETRLLAEEEAARRTWFDAFVKVLSKWPMPARWGELIAR